MRPVLELVGADFVASESPVNSCAEFIDVAGQFLAPADDVALAVDGDSIAKDANFVDVGVEDAVGVQVECDAGGLVGEIVSVESSRSVRIGAAGEASLSFAAPENETSFATRNLAGDIVVEGSRAPHDGSLVTTSTNTSYNLGGGVGRRVVITLPSTPDDLGVTPTVTEDYYLDG